MRFSDAITPTIPVRVAIYGISPSPRQIDLHAQSIGDVEFWNGSATSITVFDAIPRTYSITLWKGPQPFNTSSLDVGQTTISATPLASFDLGVGESTGTEIEINKWTISCYDTPASILVAIRPSWRAGLTDEQFKTEYTVPSFDVAIAQ